MNTALARRCLNTTDSTSMPEHHRITIGLILATSTACACTPGPADTLRTSRAAHTEAQAPLLQQGRCCKG